MGAFSPNVKLWLRIALAGGAWLLFLALTAGFRSTFSELLFFVPGPLAIAFAFIAVIAVTPKMSIRTKVIGFVGLSAAVFAVITGVMFAGCDAGMRPFIPEMVLLFFPLGLIQTPLHWIVFVLLGVVAVATTRSVQRRSRPLGIRSVAVLTCGTLLLSLSSYGVATAFGVHPIAGNCVI
jgi:uncharacterized membrane protein